MFYARNIRLGWESKKFIVKFRASSNCSLKNFHLWLNPDNRLAHKLLYHLLISRTDEFCSTELWLSAKVKMWFFINMISFSHNFQSSRSILSENTEIIFRIKKSITFWRASSTNLVANCEVGIGRMRISRILLMSKSWCSIIWDLAYRFLRYNLDILVCYYLDVCILHF